jgi:hypothetical protein
MLTPGHFPIGEEHIVRMSGARDENYNQLGASRRGVQQIMLGIDLLIEELE